MMEFGGDGTLLLLSVTFRTVHSVEIDIGSDLMRSNTNVNFEMRRIKGSHHIDSIGCRLVSDSHSLSLKR